MPSIHVRLTEQEAADLDALVVATQAYHEAEAAQKPIPAWVVKATRSSAVRDLIQAWKHGKADELFTAP